MLWRKSFSIEMLLDEDLGMPELDDVVNYTTMTLPMSSTESA